MGLSSNGPLSFLLPPVAVGWAGMSLFEEVAPVVVNFQGLEENFSTCSAILMVSERLNAV